MLKKLLGITLVIVGMYVMGPALTAHAANAMTVEVTALSATDEALLSQSLSLLGQTLTQLQARLAANSLSESQKVQIAGTLGQIGTTLASIVPYVTTGPTVTLPLPPVVGQKPTAPAPRPQAQAPKPTAPAAPQAPAAPAAPRPQQTAAAQGTATAAGGGQMFWGLVVIVLLALGIAYSRRQPQTALVTPPPSSPTVSASNSAPSTPTQGSMPMDKPAESSNSNPPENPSV